MSSNVPPFITDEFLCGELSRHGKIVSPVKKVLSGCKSLLLKHVVSQHRQRYMIPNNCGEDLNLCETQSFHVISRSIMLCSLHLHRLNVLVVVKRVI